MRNQNRFNHRSRCVDGRLMRHDPQPDDPGLETDIGKCPECEGHGCDVEIDNGEFCRSGMRDIAPDCLQRAVTCQACRWTGTNGKLIAADRLCCPSCRSDDIAWFIVDAPERLQ